MFEPSWIFYLAMITFALLIVFAVVSFSRTRRDSRKGVKTSVPRDEIDAKAKSRSHSPVDK
ncbi:MAG: hypothetical protein RIA09_02530 [Hoeflea sp.]|uniref:hypothetical protein n=1 Tax=Hoeflea sp. TaxID=1940281 RepID=UPI0032EBE5F8